METNDLMELGGQQAYLKAGIYGLQGSGKTRTATELAIGLNKYIKSEKPICFFDTETGSDFVAPIVKKNGFKLVGKKSKAFSELVRTMTKAQEMCDVMIIDSVTHIWNELYNSFRLKKYQCRQCNGTGRQGDKECVNSKCNGTGCISDRLTVYDYQPIKKEWNTLFVDPMLNARLHIVVCGRAGNEYESQENLEGKLEIVKSDTKMKAESEFGYEASLLIEMTKDKSEKGIINEAFIWKDRFDLINGKTFKMPKFEDFLPHIQSLNLGGEHISIESGNSVEMLKTPQGSAQEYTKYRDIILEKIQGAISMQFAGRSTEEAKGKLKALKDVFGTVSWTEIENFSIKVLEERLVELVVYLEALGKQESPNGKATPKEAEKAVAKGGKR